MCLIWQHVVGLGSLLNLSRSVVRVLQGAAYAVDCCRYLLINVKSSILIRAKKSKLVLKY